MIVTYPYAQVIYMIDPTRSANTLKHHASSRIGFLPLSVRPVANEQPTDIASRGATQNFFG